MFIRIFIYIILTGYAVANLTQTQADSFLKKFNNKSQSLEELFSKSFLNKVSINQLIYIRDDFNKKYGKYVKVRIDNGNKCKVYYEKAKFPSVMVFDSKGLISTLWFGAPIQDNDNIEAIRKELMALQGKVSLCLRKDGKEFFSMNKYSPMAVGSAFKLFILKALNSKLQAGKLQAGKLQAGKLHLYDTLIIDEIHKSLPSGILQSWQSGDVLTVNTASNLMISISDNTATDLLIDKIGREYIEKFAPSSMKPFYKTKEMFLLKLVKDSNYTKRFIKADISTKRIELAKLDTMSLSEANVYDFTSPRYLEIEWYVSTDELCKTIEALRTMSQLSINAGLIDKKDWYYVGFKGGSEPGVLNYTYLLQKTKSSPVYSLSASINARSDNVDKDSEFTLLIKRIIDIIEKGKKD